MVKEYRMDGFANCVVSAERKGQVADPAAYFGMGKVFFDPGTVLIKSTA